MARVLKSSHSFTCTPHVHPPAEAGTHLPTPKGWKAEWCGCRGCSHIPQKFRLGVWHAKILVYLLTCNWSSSSVKIFNTAITTHQTPIFTSECSETVWQLVSVRTCCRWELTALPQTSFKGWKGKGRREGGSERGREGGERRAKKARKGEK